MDDQQIRQHIFDGHRQALNRSCGDIRSFVEHRNPPPHKLSTKELASFRKTMWGLIMLGITAPTGHGVDELLWKFGGRKTHFETVIQQAELLGEEWAG